MHQYQICWQKFILGHDTRILPFLPVSCIVKEHLCLGGVWVVSVGVWIISKGVWQMPGGV